MAHTMFCMTTPSLHTLSSSTCLTVEKVAISFANRNRLVLKENSREGGELLVVERFQQPYGARFAVRCIAPKVRGMGNFFLKLTVRSLGLLSSYKHGCRQISISKR